MGLDTEKLPDGFSTNQSLFCIPALFIYKYIHKKETHQQPTYVNRKNLKVFLESLVIYMQERKKTQENDL